MRRVQVTSKKRPFEFHWNTNEIPLPPTFFSSFFFLYSCQSKDRMIESLLFLRLQIKRFGQRNFENKARGIGRSRVFESRMLFHSAFVEGRERDTGSADVTIHKRMLPLHAWQRILIHTTIFFVFLFFLYNERLQEKNKTSQIVFPFGSGTKRVVLLRTLRNFKNLACRNITISEDIKASLVLRIIEKSSCKLYRTPWCANFCPVY